MNKIIITIIVTIITIISLIISLSLFFAIIFQDIEKIDESNLSICTTKNLTTSPFRCCKKESCSCVTCDGFDSCSSMLFSLTDGSCCGDFHCCYYGCSTCYRTETYSCNCARTCSICTRQVSYQCDCNCKAWVLHESCSIHCGTCNNMQADVIIIDKKYATVTEHSVTKTCELDELNCVDEFKNKWQINNANCWWREEIGEIYLEKPKYNIEAIVFMAIFGTITLYAPLGLLVYWLYNRYKIIKLQMFFLV